MKKLLLTASFLTFVFASVNAQKGAKNIFAELGGPGLASINYDQRISGREDGLGFRAGIGGFSIKDDYTGESAGVLFVPLGLNYLLGKDGRNYFELGAGATIVSAGESSSDGTFTGTFGHLNLGYRLQPSSSGFTFRAAINPIFGHGAFVPYYGGVSFGYKF